MSVKYEKYVNDAIKTFDEAEKIIDLPNVEAVVNLSVSLLEGIRNGIVSFAEENTECIRNLHKQMSSEMGSKAHYKMQSTAFADSSFKDYIAKVVALPEAIHNGNIPEESSLDAGFFNRDKDFNIAIFSTDENEVVTIPAEDAFNELQYMARLIEFVDWAIGILKDKANLVPKFIGDQMDGVTASKHTMGTKAMKLLATSMVRYAALLYRHLLNNTSQLYQHAMPSKYDNPFERKPIPSIYWGAPNWNDVRTDEDTSDRWAIFV